MNKIYFTLILLLFPFYLYADRDEIVLMPSGNQHNHGEYYIPEDLPVVYFDPDEMEIIIEAEGFADYYTVEVISMVSGLTLIYTQIDGYGDTIDVSSLPDAYYEIIITSSNNNVFEGTFLIE